MEPSARHFETYLKTQASKGYDPKGEFFEGRIDCFFPVAVRELLKDGMALDDLAHMLISSAHEAFVREAGLSAQSANDKIIQIALNIATMTNNTSN